MSISAAAPAAHREVLAGLIERVTFHNEQNGFCVLQFKARGQRDLVTVVGHAAAISAGEFIQAIRIPGGRDSADHPALSAAPA